MGKDLEDADMDKVGAEDISLELFKISKKLMDLSDVAAIVVNQPTATQALIELSDSTKLAADCFLDLAG